MAEETNFQTNAAVFRKLEWQTTLFAPKPQRSALLKLTPIWPCQTVRIRVHRNQAFEHVASVMAPYLAYADWQGQFHYSEYDDSLNFDLTGEAEVEILWLDFDRLGSQLAPHELAQWLAGRIQQLRQLSRAPILVLNRAGGNAVAREFNARLARLLRELPGVRLGDLGPICGQLGSDFFDERAAALSGSRLSNAACLLIARELACHWLPALLRPRIKAVVLDLDNTLFGGILGEDGADGIQFTAPHRSLHRHLLKLHAEGLLLALASRNETADVRALFAVRQDFPLRWGHFAATAIDWSEKTGGLANIAQALRIGLDAMLVVDDNPGELAALAQAWPKLHLLHASADAGATTLALVYYPGLWAWATGEADLLRAADLQSAEQRQASFMQAADPAAYFQELQVKLDFAVNPRGQLERLHELCQKTNQFNLNLRRLSEVDLAQYLESPERRVVSIRLRDRLSDSGIIGLVAGRREAATLVIEEVCVSCRALGRQLEDLMIGEAVRLIAADLPASRVEFVYRTGPRNEPARKWLSQLTGQTLLDVSGRLAVPADFGRQAGRTMPVEINRIINA